MKTKNNKYILDIIPLTKIPLTRNQSFSYLSEKELSIGSLVQVPLFKRKVEGIVIGARKDFPRLGNIELKKIDSIIEENFLTRKQIELAQFIFNYYISPLGIILKGFVPKRVRSKKTAINNRTKELSNSKKIILTEKQQDAVRKIINDKNVLSEGRLKTKKFLLFGPAASGKTEIYIHSILKLKNIDSQLQFLILIPEHTLTPQALERYGSYFSSQEIVLLTSNISKSQYYTNWQKIKSGESKIIIGTRMSVFAPFQKLGLIIIDEEQDMSFKQWDMNPRYDARLVAEKIASLHNCPLIRGSATPSIESYYRAKNQELKLINLPPLNLEEIIEKQRAKNRIITTRRVPVSFSVVDMRRERWEKNQTSISRKLKGEIKYVLENKQQAIIFVNRQGMSAFSVCTKCKTVLRCPQCERSLAYDVKGNYRCLHCSFETSIFPKCCSCQNDQFKNIGLGTQKIEREIRNLFPSARIARIDNQTGKTSGLIKKIYQEFKNGEADILIGTQMITKGWDLPQVSLVGIIDTDNLLSFPDFFNQEKFFQHLTQVAGRVARPGAKFPGVIIIQTFQPESKLLKLIVEKRWEDFYDLEIVERKDLNLPPWGKLIKLIFQDYSLSHAEAEGKRISKLLENIPSIKASEAQDAFLPKVRGRYRKQILIKYPNKLSLPLKKLLMQLPSGWNIDIDPISVL